MRSLPDTNVWLALMEPNHVHHPAVVAWMSVMELENSVAFCRATQMGFMRLLTTAAVLAPYRERVPSNAMAWSLFTDLLADDRVLFAPEPAGLDPRWKGFSEIRTASPKLWMDAYLAAFAISGGYQLVTTDKAFKQFAGLDMLLLG